MTSPSIADTQADSDALYCYRHPNRQVWVICGRCDLDSMLVDAAAWALITAGAAAVGAWSRLR